MNTERKENHIPFEFTRNQLASMWNVDLRDVSIEDALSFLFPRCNCFISGRIILDHEASKHIKDPDNSFETVLTQQEQ